jgi:uncharacterized protein YcbK (DUF882 family)
MLDLSRRSFIKGLGVIPLLGVPKLLRAAPLMEKKLILYNIHTGEWFKEVMWAGKSLIAEHQAKLDHFLRDWRTNDRHHIDPRLIGLLMTVKDQLPSKSHFTVICGYRCPKTNQDLRKSRKGVAKNSLHCQGKAVDIQCKDIALRKLRDLVKRQKMGGVGYYPATGFVHADIRERPYYW